MAAEQTAQAIRYYRELRSYSGSALCRELGIDRSTLYLWESGKRTPSPDNLRKLAEILKVDVNKLR